MKHSLVTLFTSALAIVLTFQCASASSRENEKYLRHTFFKVKTDKNLLSALIFSKYSFQGSELERLHLGAISDISENNLKNLENEIQNESSTLYHIFLENLYSSVRRNDLLNSIRTKSVVPQKINNIYKWTNIGLAILKKLDDKCTYEQAEIILTELDFSDKHKDNRFVRVDGSSKSKQILRELKEEYLEEKSINENTVLIRTQNIKQNLESLGNQDHALCLSSVSQVIVDIDSTYQLRLESRESSVSAVVLSNLVYEFRK
ncbi:MAG TPA: hypothetical protein PLJ21_06485 [Pseudobdellovibrionaceae bacterium]|nr:hypothetical protein [Pseudobdellovibrionaceae bacterium]